MSNGLWGRYRTRWMNRLWPGRIRLHVRLRFGWLHLRASRPRGLTGGAVMRDDSRLDLGLVPWSKIDDQHAEHANNGNRNRDNQRRAAPSPDLNFARMILRHFNAAVWFPLMESNPGGNEGSPLLASADEALAEQTSCPCIVGDQTPCSRSAALLSELQNVNTETPELSQPGMAERAIDTATDVSRTITDVSAALRAAVDRLSDAIATARQPGKPLCHHQRNHPRSAARKPVRRLPVRRRGGAPALAPTPALRTCLSLRPWRPT